MENKVALVVTMFIGAVAGYAIGDYFGKKAVFNDLREMELRVEVPKDVACRICDGEIMVMQPVNLKQEPALYE